MASRAPGRATDSHAWTDKILAELPDHRNNAKFWENGLNTGVRVLEDGRLDIKLDQDKSNLGNLLQDVQNRKTHQPPPERQDPETSRPEEDRGISVHLNIVIHVVGSRGDVQPFIALGRELKKHGHRVRLATHLAFRDFVNENGLEFFSIGGDPSELMAFMVKNPGLLPDLRTIRSGDIQRRRQEMKTIFMGCWRSCYEMGDNTDNQDELGEPWSGIGDYRTRPFVADAIIANPPSYAHISCAEKMGIPLHMMFTMPWSPTQHFPHPLANVRARNTKPSVANFASYAIVEMMIWEGLGGLINKFRKRVLGLDPLDGMRAPSLIPRLKIPYSYLWSPSLLGKPSDWEDNIDICGFSFLSTKSDYQPPEDLAAFLQNGPPPIYIGFGSIVVDDAAKLTRTLFDAVKATGQRALISKGWGNVGSEEVEVPENILLLGNCPHDWLFQHVSCVIHHGGAGTTAAGLAQGRPTVVIPFFGDQPFWGSIIARSGAGPDPLPFKQLTTEKLTEAITKALDPSIKERAVEISEKMKTESGVCNAVQSFYRHLDLDTLRCSICPHLPAVWKIRKSKIRLSAFAATILVQAGLLKPYDVELNRPIEYDTRRNPRGPLSAGVEVFYGAISSFISNVQDVPTGLYATTYDTMFTHRGNEAAHCPQREENDNDDDEYDPFDECSEAESEPEASGQNGVGITKKVTTLSSRRRRRPENSGRFSEVGHHTGQIAKHILDWMIMLPGDITLSLSRGFHNAPELYHDRTVTTVPKVIGARSGFHAAKEEFTSSFYNGITGLVTHPTQGYHSAGIIGLLKGIGKGIGGVFFKPPAGLWGLAGYPLDGIHKDIRRSLSTSSRKQVVASHIAQGIESLCSSSTEERATVIRIWKELRKLDS